MSNEEKKDHESNEVAMNIENSEAIKKPVSAWIIFSSEHRKKLAASKSGTSFTDSARIIADAYKALSADERKHYENLALLDKERYQRELELRGEVSDPKDRIQIQHHSTTHLELPLARIRRTIKLDPEMKNISKEALSCVTKLTELFVEELAQHASKYAIQRGAKTIKGSDVGLSIYQVPYLEFLKEDFPYDEDLAKASKAAASVANKHRRTVTTSSSNNPSSKTASITSYFANKRSLEADSQDNGDSSPARASLPDDDADADIETHKRTNNASDLYESNQGIDIDAMMTDEFREPDPFAENPVESEFE